jgi:hypothetical protein
MSERDRQRTHIFSNYFYKRLTLRPPVQKNKLHPVEDDVNLTPAQVGLNTPAGLKPMMWDRCYLRFSK